MTFSQLQDRARVFRPVLRLEHFLPHRVRRWIEVVLLVVAIVAIVVIIARPAGNPVAGGVFFLALTLWMPLVSIDAFYYSLYFRGSRDERGMTYELARIVEQTDVEDLMVSFLATTAGHVVARRAGLGEEDISSFKENRMTPLSGYAVEFPENVRTLDAYATALAERDEEFDNVLFRCGLTRETFVAAARWVQRGEQHVKFQKRWWSREHLARTRPIGEEWSYGSAYTLAQYSQPIEVSRTTSFYEEYITSLETILSRHRDANALVVGDAGIEKMEVVAGLEQRIRVGEAGEELEHYSVSVLDVDLLDADVTGRHEFESRLLKLLSEAEAAGNIIIAIRDVAQLIRAGTSFGTDAISLMEPYLTSPSLHIIAVADTKAFHEHVEPNGLMMQRFERVFLHESDHETTVRLLEDEALDVEARHHVLFTYPVIERVATAARQYYGGSGTVTRAIDLLYDVASMARKEERSLITRSDVDQLVERRTGIPVSEPEGDEQQKLLNLEDRLHERVVGQDAAVQAVANALRRARSGLADAARPMGSLLFLGPTGVGKTETTKALADVFFNDESQVVRLDMSEFSGDGAVAQLIGSKADNSPGLLASRLRDKPYGVLHLDEFEKASGDVLNLFLQILENGAFTDAFGRQVNARNTIIIATSNAGSDLIWDYMKGKGKPEEYKDVIINTIIKRGTFTPELVNRFDNVVLFHPLADEHLRDIAQRLLAGLNERLKQKGVELVVTDELVSYLVEIGSNPEFGARPLRRAIQDTVEQVVANKLMRGEIEKGSRFELSPDELKRESGTSSGEKKKGSEYTFGFEDEE